MGRKIGQRTCCSICRELGHNKAYHDNPQTKHCVACDKMHPIKNFRTYPRKNGANPQMCSVCSECENKRLCEYQKDQRHNSIHHRMSYLCSSVKFGARKRNLDFDLTVEWLEDLYDQQDGKCFYSGVGMSMEPRTSKSISLDRRDSNKGYTKDNVNLVCLIVNNIKHDKSEQDFIKYCQIMGETYIEPESIAFCRAIALHITSK